MDHDLRNRWVRALLSGKYQQTQGRLRRTVPLFSYDAGYCCLGVLCDIDGNVEQRDEPGVEIVEFLFPTNESSITSITDSYREEIGLSEDDMHVLMQMNDDGKDFNTIAMWILRNV